MRYSLLHDVLQISTGSNHDVGADGHVALLEVLLCKVGHSAALVHTDNGHGAFNVHGTCVNNLSYKGQVCAALFVCFQHSLEVDVADHVAVGHHNIILGAAIDKVDRTLERIQSGAVDTGSGGIKHGDVRRQNLDTARTASQIPVLTVADMVKQRLIIVVGNHAHLGNIGIDHIGKREVDQTVSAAKGDRRHSAQSGHFGNAVIVRICKN